MVNRNTDRLASIEPWSPLAFVAGGLLSLVALELAAHGVRGPTVVAAAGGLAVVVGLGGVYSKLSTPAPWLALSGGTATALAGLGFTYEVVVTSATVLPGAPVAPLLAGGGPLTLTVAYWTLGAGLLLAGVGGLRTGATTRPVGLLLVVASLSYPAVRVVHELLIALPAWHSPAHVVAFGAAVILAGVLQDAERVVADGWVPSGLPDADPGTNGGWTNEHVRDEYDVDGSESRTSRLRMETRLHLKRMAYEVWPRLVTEGRVDDRSVSRRLGRLLRRDGAAVEQSLAEHEYLREAVTATDREGVGSPHWRLGVTAGVGLVLICLFGLPWLVTSSLWWFVGRSGAEAGVLAALVAIAGGAGTLGSVARSVGQLADRT